MAENHRKNIENVENIDLMNKLQRIMDPILYSIHNKIDLKNINAKLSDMTGITDFFHNKDEILNFKSLIHKPFHEIGIFDQNQWNKKLQKQDMGDFQTPESLATKICQYIKSSGLKPTIIIEPTCGLGTFVISAIETFPSLRDIYSLDIQPKYEWLLKLNILLSSIKNIPHISSVNIEFHLDSIFNHMFSDEIISKIHDSQANLLILGNPPWVTNSELERKKSTNLPNKINLKGFSGIDSITGKSNFDITEYIIIDLVRNLTNMGIHGKICLLCKNSVITNLVRDNHRLGLKLSNIQMLQIDSNKEFGINASASLFCSDFGLNSESTCLISSLYYSSDLNNSKNKPFQDISFGWIDGKFVSNAALYEKVKFLDGKCVFEWRQGLKHDLSNLMMLKPIDPPRNEAEEEQKDMIYVNKLGEQVKIETEYVYPCLKSSEIKSPIIDSCKSYVIVTQKAVNQSTNNLERDAPLLWKYLESHKEDFQKRRSKIYQNKYDYSIFGIGEYAFKPYKIVVSGFYKNINFALVRRINNKDVMVDDTCYYLSFDDENLCIFVWAFLNMPLVKKFLESIVFLDGKRPYTKEILMRISITQLINRMSYDEFYKFYDLELASIQPFKGAKELYFEQVKKIIKITEGFET